MGSQIQDRGDFVEIRLVGEQRVENIRSMFERIREKVSNWEGKPVLIDGSTSEYSGGGIEKAYSAFREEMARSGCRVALVVGSGFQFGLAGMISAHASLEDEVIRPFRNRSDAMSWLMRRQGDGRKNGSKDS